LQGGLPPDLGGRYSIPDDLPKARTAQKEMLMAEIDQARSKWLVVIRGTSH
jgi:hypothetical protein